MEIKKMDKKFKRFCVSCWLIILLVSSLWAMEASERSDYLFRFVQISDSQPTSEEGWQALENIVEIINNLKPGFVLYAGDLTDTGKREDYKRIKEIIDKLKSPVYAVPGNHDFYSPANQQEKELTTKEIYEKKFPLYREFLGDDQWSFEYGDFQFVGFNVCAAGYALCDTPLEGWPNISADQMKWLNSTFKASDKPYKVLVSHYPITFNESEQNINKIMHDNKVMMNLHGHNHVHDIWDKNPEHGYLQFSSVLIARGFIYFDVYENNMLAFWRPVKGPIRPLGMYNIKELYKKLPHRAEKIAKAPYLQNLTQNSVTIQWEMFYSPTEYFQTTTAKDAGIFNERKLHTIKLDGLESDTDYTYPIKFDSATLADFARHSKHDPSVVKFHTLAVNPDKVSFLLYGDTRSNADRHKSVITAMLNMLIDTGKKADLVLHTGDLVTNGRVSSQWDKEYFAPAAPLLSKLPLYPVMGNHEGNVPLYFRYFNLPLKAHATKGWYTHFDGNVQFFHLYAYEMSEPQSEQLIDFEKWLKDSKALWKIVVCHQIPYSSGGHSRRNENSMYKEKTNNEFVEFVEPLLEKYNVDIVFGGHDHLYERSKKNDIYYIISGGGGAPTYPAAFPNPYSQAVKSILHYCYVEVEGANMNMAVYDVDNNLIDTLEIHKAPLLGERVKQLEVQLQP